MNITPINKNLIHTEILTIAFWFLYFSHAVSCGIPARITSVISMSVCWWWTVTLLGNEGMDEFTACFARTRWYSTKARRQQTTNNTAATTAMSTMAPVLRLLPPPCPEVDGDAD